MENIENKEQNEQQVIVVKSEELESLSELGFKEEDDGLMVLETETGAIGVDKESGVVAVASDGVSVEELAIVTELVSSGVAETVNASELEIEEVKEELDGASATTTNEGE